MSKAPFLPLATDAFIGDTTGLNAAETGAYMMLLICQWRNNGLPLENNPKKLQRMTRCTKAQYNRVWPEIAHFFEVTETTISQKRVEKDFLEVLKKIQVKRESGKLGGRPKSLEYNGAHKANGYDSLKLNESETKATINHNHKLEKKEVKEDAKASPQINLRVQEIIDLWNKTGLKKVVKITSGRRQSINRRTKEDFKDLAAWDGYFQMFIDSHFLSGSKGSWVATFDWALKPSNMVKVLEGNYSNDANGFDASAYIKEMTKDYENENT
jgi:uncharacterized protein YdaU (DUF1376 family)